MEYHLASLSGGPFGSAVPRPGLQGERDGTGG